ncbi:MULTISPECIES: hypothetical protein [Klebsiella]|uniref:hypothetical protein n=1 Tax=Klebsiella TaxID=570 RepID=UPI001890F7E4|nr:MULTISPECIES: hypothetical protein [Klebsiella]MBS6906141.1 hypothetical protein [Klebsiella sp.]
MFFISPIFGVILSYVIFLVSFFIPSGLFYSLVGEYNYGYLSVENFCLVTVSVVFFVLGLRCYGFFPKKNSDNSNVSKDLEIPVNALIYLLVLLNVLMFIIIYLIIKNNAGLISTVLYYSGGVKTLKTDMDLTGTYASVTSAIYGLSIWCLYSYFKIRDKLLLSKRKIYFFLIFLLYLLLIIKTLILLARFELMPILLSFVVIFLWSKYKDGKSLRVFIMLIAFFLSIISIFFIISSLRNTDGTSHDSWVSFFGYVFVPYSHLGALLMGKLRYYDPGFGYYAINYLNSLPVIGNSFTSNYLGWTDSYLVWQKEFQDTWKAGLNGDLIWITAFGYLWVSLKFFTPIYMFVNGLLVQHIWLGFKREKLIGVVFYPWCFFCILFWFGMNMISFRTTLYLFISYTFAVCFTFLCKKNNRS